MDCYKAEDMVLSREDEKEIEYAHAMTGEPVEALAQWRKEKIAEDLNDYLKKRNDMISKFAMRRVYE